MAAITRVGVRAPVGVGLATATMILVQCLMALIGPGTAQAAFPGDNGKIVFNSNRDVAAGEIYSIAPGAAAARLTTSTTSSDPAYSPDGNRIAYVSANPGGGYQIFVMNADGSGRTPVTNSSPAKQQPAWSADGTQIAYVGNSFHVDGQTDLEIWVVNANGTQPRQLTHNSVADTYPAWSPTGGKIAFVSTGDVYVMNTDGTGRTNLTPNSPPGCAPNCYQGGDERSRLVARRQQDRLRPRARHQRRWPPGYLDDGAERCRQDQRFQ